jgi:hypothetical protein
MRTQHFPAVGFAGMPDGHTITVPYFTEPHHVRVSADWRVDNQRANGREITYQLDEQAKTITFMMVSNGNLGGAARGRKPVPIARPAKATVSSMQGRRKAAPAVAPIAAPKRAGARRTVTPGSKRTRSLMSVASWSAISSLVMTVTVAGASSCNTGARVAVTVMRPVCCWFSAP